VKQAEENGRSLDLWETAASLLDELKAKGGAETDYPTSPL
jgi:hypothetical protein